MENRFIRSDQEKKYNSLMDEIQRNQRIVRKIKFSKNYDIDTIWNAFIKAFKKTFKIQRELEVDLKFSLKIDGIHTNHTIDKYDVENKIISISWKHGEDKYWMEYRVRKNYLNKKKCLLKITYDICKNSPFFGLQDTVGLFFLKRSFKKNIKSFRESIFYILKNPDEII